MNDKKVKHSISDYNKDEDRIRQEGQHPLTGQRAANFRLMANQWSVRRLVTQWRHGCCTMRWNVCNAGASNWGRSLSCRYQGNRATPCQYWYHSKGNWLRYNFAANSFYIMLIFALDKLNIRHISTSGLVDLLPWKCVTWCAPRGDSFHQVWRWYDHPLPSYSVIAADTLRDLVTLTFDLLTLVSGHTWRVTWSIPPPSLKILRLFVLEL